MLYYTYFNDKIWHSDMERLVQEHLLFHQILLSTFASCPLIKISNAQWVYTFDAIFRTKPQLYTIIAKYRV